MGYFNNEHHHPIPPQEKLKSNPFVFVCMSMKHVVMCMLLMGQNGHGFVCVCISAKSSSAPTPIFECDKASFSWVYSSLYVTVQNHRIIKFQGTSVDCLVQPLCPKQCQLGQTSTVSSQTLSISKNCDSATSLSPNSTVCGTKHWLWDRKWDEEPSFMIHTPWKHLSIYFSLTTVNTVYVWV